MTEAPITWESLNLNEIAEATNPPSTERSEVQPGNYKLKFVGAKKNPYREGDTDLDFVIVSGPETRRHVFASLPQPGKGEWVRNAAANLIKQLGGDHKQGESLIDALNRIAANGANAVTADVADGSYTNKANELVYKPKLQFFSITASL